MLMIVKGSEVRDGEPRRYAEDIDDAEEAIAQLISGAVELQSWATADSPLAIVDRPMPVDIAPIDLPACFEPSFPMPTVLCGSCGGAVAGDVCQRCGLMIRSWWGSA